jgi:hypothetical protein
MKTFEQGNMNNALIRRADGSVLRVIKAKDAKAGMTLGYDNPRLDEYIDDVGETQDGEIVLYTGIDGTSTHWRQADELMCVVWR